MHVKDACSTGSHQKSLEAIRDKLAEAMDAAEPAVVAQIAGRLQAVLAELAAEFPSVEENAVDDLVAYRREYRAASDAKLRPKKRRPRTELGA